MGSSMIFNIAQSVKEWLDDNNIKQEDKEKIKIMKQLEEAEVSTSSLFLFALQYYNTLLHLIEKCFE
jgi:hypothetical protein